MGLLTIVAVLTVWYLRREWTQYVVAATAVFPQTAALILGKNGFPLFYLAIVLLLMLAIPNILYAIARPEYGASLSSRRWSWPDLISITLVAWAAILAFAAPRIFAGVQVYGPELGIGAVETIPLEPTLGNLAQLGYLTLAIAFLVSAGRLFPVDTRIIGATVWLTIGLATLRLIGEPLSPHDVVVTLRQALQNMPGFNYATPERLSGTLHEPSVLGMYLVVAAAYFVARLRFPGRPRVMAIIGLGIVVVDFVFNQSGTAQLGLGALLALGLLAGAFRLARTSRLTLAPVRLGLSILVGGLALAQLPLVYALTVGYAAEKTQTDSFSERGASNLRSWQIVIETFGVGVGLGSHRPSSLLFLVVSCLGLFGLGLLTALVVLALRRVSRILPARPAGWAAVGAIAAAVIAVPDLSAPLLWITLTACFAVPDGREQDRVNPDLNPRARALDTPLVRVPAAAGVGDVTPSLGGTRMHHPFSPPQAFLDPSSPGLTVAEPARASRRISA
ncbi:MAG: hypothetical protein Q8M65_02105 [Rhodoglobus sp.]|nr:hypothetical protein [Rhodoglobus sp.]